MVAEERDVEGINLIEMGELSSARQALEGAEIAPGTEETLSKLTDTSKRPDRLRDPIPREVIEHAQPDQSHWRRMSSSRI